MTMNFGIGFLKMKKAAGFPPPALRDLPRR
jgi:hypothetical protein